MPYIMTDVESDGEVPGLFSMVSFGAIVVEPGLTRTFYGQCRPISEQWVPKALAVSGHTREQTMAFPTAEETMPRFAAWLKEVSGGKTVRFISDNNGFDWQFVNYYFHAFNGRMNPFGHSSRNLGDLYKGMQKDVFVNFKHLRQTKHTHHPVDDARGNAEALLKMKELGLKISWE